MQHSYWETKEYFSNVDYTIIGSGIVGINTALSLRKRFPKAKILILEKGYLPAGASSKNAGFACFGSPSELLSDLKTNSEESVLELIQLRKKGLNKLIETCGSKHIDYQVNGSYDVFTSKETQLFEQCKNQLEKLNRLLTPVFKEDVFVKSDYSINQFGLKNVKHLIKNKFEGQIDTGKMFTKLIELSQQNNIKILNGVSVKSVEEFNTKAEIHLENGVIFSSTKVLIATNGFAKNLLPKTNVKPARAQVLITKPIENLKIKGTFHVEEGYYYFRNIDNRILLGGGRNLDFEGETSTELKTTPLIQQKLEELLSTVILPNQQFEIEQRWAGVMGVGTVKKPIVKQLSNSIYCGVRMGGMGVAVGSIIGEQLADLID